jgi:hypothetical protein
MKNTVDVTGGKHIAVLLQSMSGDDIHGRKREVLYFCLGLYTFKSEKIVKYTQ